MVSKSSGVFFPASPFSCGFHSASTSGKGGTADSAGIPHENVEEEWNEEVADGGGGASVIDMDDL